METYEELELQKLSIEDVSIGLRQIGKGENLVFIHGFPTHGYTWRKVLPELSAYFRCHVLDLPGLGDSEWTAKTDFNSKAQARYILKLLDKIGIDSYSLIAHNSGATIARYIALEEKDKVKNLIILNTEIPDHRPPWIPFYQKIGLLPAVPTIIRSLLKRRWFIRSSMGFKEFYSDKAMLDHESNIAPYVNPFIHSQAKTIGAFKYLKGIDWKLIDEFKYLHKEIKARTLLIWGKNDRTFPIEYGKQMVQQFTAEIEFIATDASLLPHEEKPDEVVSAVLRFVKNNPT